MDSVERVREELEEELDDDFIVWMRGSVLRVRHGKIDFKMSRKKDGSYRVYGTAANGSRHDNTYQTNIIQQTINTFTNDI